MVQCYIIYRCVRCQLSTLLKMNRCKLCVTPVLNCRERRRLSASSSAHCTRVLVDLVSESGTTETNATKEYSSGYLCKKCFTSVAKYSALKEEAASLKRELLSKLSTVVASGSANVPERQGTKRSKRSSLNNENAVKVIKS